MHETIHFVCLGAAVPFAVMPFKRSRERAEWARWIFFAIAAIFLIVAACGFSLDFQLWQPAEHDKRNLDYWLEGVRGFALGCFFVLLISGQFFGKKS